MIKSELFGKVGSSLLLSLAIIATITMTMIGNNSSSIQVWADVFEDTEGPDVIVGTPQDDLIDSRGGFDINFGDTEIGDGSGDDILVRGKMMIPVAEVEDVKYLCVAEEKIQSKASMKLKEI